MSVFFGVWINLITFTPKPNSNSLIITHRDEESLKLVKELVYKNFNIKRKRRPNRFQLKHAHRFKYLDYFHHIEACLLDIFIQKSLLKDSGIIYSFLAHLSVSEYNNGIIMPSILNLNNRIFFYEAFGVNYEDYQYFYNCMSFIYESEHPEVFSFFFYLEVIDNEWKRGDLRTVNPLGSLKPYLRSSSDGLFLFVPQLPSTFVHQLSIFYDKLLTTYNRKRKKPKDQDVYNYLNSLSNFLKT
jgi:hypothetical protein